MLNEIERVISYIAACLIHNKKFYHIYALENNKYFDYSFSGYNVYDYSRECFCSISKLSPSKYNYSVPGDLLPLTVFCPIVFLHHEI